MALLSNNDVLNIGAVAAHENSIIEKEFYSYTPFTKSYDDSDDIHIAIQNQDSYLLPRESYL